MEYEMLTVNRITSLIIYKIGPASGIEPLDLQLALQIQKIHNLLPYTMSIY